MTYKERQIHKYMTSFRMNHEDAEEFFVSQMLDRAYDVSLNTEMLKDKITYSEALKKNVVVPE